MSVPACCFSCWINPQEWSPLPDSLIWGKNEVTAIENLLESGFAQYRNYLMTPEQWLINCVGAASCLSWEAGWHLGRAVLAPSCTLAEKESELDEDTKSMQCLKYGTSELTGGVAVLLRSLTCPVFGRLLVCDRGKNKSVRCEQSVHMTSAGTWVPSTGRVRNTRVRRAGPPSSVVAPNLSLLSCCLHLVVYTSFSLGAVLSSFASW